jgi:tRNA(Ile)-lysidine synthase
LGRRGDAETGAGAERHPAPGRGLRGPGRVRPPLRRPRLGRPAERGDARARRRGLRLSQAAALDAPFGAVAEILTARLRTDTSAPVALALSGGGDSIALLRLAAPWAKAHGRRLLALTVDHGLNPDGACWSDFARQAAEAAGADWRGLSWDGPKPETGLPAAARRVRHALLAEAARDAGARVILFAHTADDVAEGEVMRAQGSTLGRLREWSPSPAWPEGRGVMLLRPMLGAGRSDIRGWLTRQGTDWIDDPANEDARFARARARTSLLPMGEGGGAEPRRMRVGPLKLGRQPALTLSGSALPFGSRKNDRSALVRSSPLPMGEGTFEANRTLNAQTLATALVCAGGGDQPPRGEQLDALKARLHAGEDFTAALAGARVEARGDAVLITREAGEFARRPLAPLPLPPGQETVWDGRWAIAVDEPGWFAVPAAGRRARLSRADRAWLEALPAAARGGQPVLIRNAPDAAVLARTAGRARSLVEQRLALALDTTTHERDLD